MSFTPVETVEEWYNPTEKKAAAENKKELAKLEKSLENWAARIKREKERYKEASGEALDGYDNTKAKIEEIKAALTAENTGVAEGITYTGHIVTDFDFSIAEYCGRYYVDKMRTGFSADKYHDTDAAEIVPEGGKSTEKNLTKYMTRIETESDERIIFDDILAVRESLKNDDPEAVDAANESAHAKHIINAENKAIFEKLTGAKDAEAVQAANLNAAINAKLCGKAKRGAEIWTNKTGFAALDVDDANGAPIIKKNGNGDFIYKDKYIVREFANETLPDTDQGAPVLIGDFKNIVRFAVNDPRPLAMLDLYRCVFLDRIISAEIPVLTTTSDEAYINGYIAN